MTFAPARCRTLLIPTGPIGDHLFVMATDACKDGKHLLVNFSTIRSGSFYDETCIIQPGEHPFITAPSYAVYRGAMVQTGERLAKMVDAWMYKTHHDASDDLTSRVLAGATVSRFIPRHIKQYLAALG